MKYCSFFSVQLSGFTFNVSASLQNLRENGKIRILFVSFLFSVLCFVQVLPKMYSRKRQNKEEILANKLT